MAHGPLAFKQTDVTRAVKAITAAGQSVAGVKFDSDGGFTVLIGETAATQKPNPWDAFEPDFERRRKKDNG